MLIYERLQESEPSTNLKGTKKLIFNASEGWLTGFLKRHAFHNVKIKGEIASADENAAKSFPEKLVKITDFLIKKQTSENVNNKPESSLDSNSSDVLDISTDESNFCPVGNKRSRLLSSSDEGE